MTSLGHQGRDKAVGPLAGIRVLDLTQFLSGPSGTQILGDLGAEVIKVESPAGDHSRTVAPHFVRGESVYYYTINRNKRSIVVDLKAEGAVEFLQSLVDVSDIVIENFRPGVLSRLGFDRETERKRRPEVVWCSISGFGQTGPSRDLPAYDMIVQALSGSMSLTGEENGHPVRTGIPLGDLAAGLHAVIGVLAALQRRNATGLGDFIDISMLDCLVAMLNYQGSYYLNSGVVPGLQGTGHDSVPTYRAFATKGGTDLVTTANTERMWSSMATILGCGHLLSDDRFTTNTDRLRNKHALWDIIEPAFLQRPAVEWLKLFNEASIPAAIVKDLAAALSDPQVLHREMIIQLEDADGTTVRTVGNPIKLQDAVVEKHSFPPRKGADGVSILQEVLGLDPATIQSLAQRGVVVLDQPDRPDVHNDESRPNSRIPTA